MLPATLNLYDLKLPVFLGVPEAERQQTQVVSLDLQFRFSKPPSGCQTDRIQDTVCYAELAHCIETSVGNRHYHLIEYLAQQLLETVSNALSSDIQVSLKLRKNPPLAHLGCSEFCLGEWKT